jgi:hypothetical protein
MSPRRTPSTLLLAIGLAGSAAAGLVACSSEPERSVANYCTQAETLRTLDEDLASGDPVRISARATDLRLLREVAPSDIEPSVAVLVDVTDDFATTAGTATDRDDVAKVVFRGRSDDLPAIEAAGTAVASYTTQNCEVALGGSSTSSSTTTATPDAGAGDPGADPAPPSSTPGAPSTTTTSTPSLLVD